MKRFLMSVTYIVVTGLIFICVPNGAARAGIDTLTINALKDNTLIEDPSGSLSNGAGPSLFIGRTSQSSGSIRHAVIAFDVAAHLPGDANVTGAALTLHASEGNPGPATVSLHTLLSDWGEGVSSHDGGRGAPATLDDATWIHRFHDVEFWQEAGGDFSDSASAAIDVDGPGAYTWAGTPAMIEDVQSWLDNPESNFGWILIGDEDFASTAKRFDSRESLVPSQRPVLVVRYERPPGSACRDAGLTGAAFGLCTAYCDALDCDGDALLASDNACDHLQRNFERLAGGVPLPCEIKDGDGDGVEDELDNCPMVPNQDQTDSDEDSHGDVCDNCPEDVNPGQEDSFGEVGVGDACDCPCFVSMDVTDLIASLSDSSIYGEIMCIDTRISQKPLTTVAAFRIDEAPCGSESTDCSALAFEFTEDNICQFNPVAPAPAVQLQGISDRQRETCREYIVEAADVAGLPCN
jgi:hypothetical protein